MTRRSVHRSAFSLLELLIVVGVIALLIGVLIPALRGGHREAKLAVDLAIHRNLFAGLQMYAQNNDLQFPFFASAPDLLAPPVIRGYVATELYYWDQRKLWISVVAPEYYEPVDARVDVLYGVYPPGEDPMYPGAPPEMFQTQYLLTATAFAQPRYFRGDIAPRDTTLLRSTRWTDIAFPSHKGLILNYFLASRDDLDGWKRHENDCTLSMGDGSASLRDWKVPGWEDRVVTRPYLPVQPVTSTRDGLAGRDY